MTRARLTNAEAAPRCATSRRVVLALLAATTASATEPLVKGAPSGAPLEPELFEGGVAGSLG